MSVPAAKPVYLVDASSDPVVVRVDGRACFQNSGCLRDFISELLRQGRRRFVLDFQNCVSMDSTFLGVLAGAAGDLQHPLAFGEDLFQYRKDRRFVCFAGFGVGFHQRDSRMA